MTKFYAQEPHLDGSKLYQPGDPREADENDVKHLVDLGVLSTEKPKAAKSEGAASKNKAEQAPANKAEQARANKAEQAPAKKAG